MTRALRSRISAQRSIVLLALCVATTNGLAQQNVNMAAGTASVGTSSATWLATTGSGAPDLETAFFLVTPVSSAVKVQSLNSSGTVLGEIRHPNNSRSLDIFANGITASASGFFENSYVGRQMNNLASFIGHEYAGGTIPTRMNSLVFGFDGASILQQRSLANVVLSGINNNGWLIGMDASPISDDDWQQNDYSNGRHFIERDGVQHVLPISQGDGDLFAVNDKGEVVGADYATVSAIHFDAARRRTVLPGYHYLLEEAHMINSGGQIIGISVLPPWVHPDEPLVAVFWQSGRAGKMDVLELDSGYPYSWPYGINRYGQIVGETATGPALWLNKKLVNLSGKLINPDNRSVYWFRDINDRGEILGSGAGSSAVLLKPVW